MLHQIKTKVKDYFKKRYYENYAVVIEGIMSSNFNYEVIQNELNLPFNSLSSYQRFITDVHFSQISSLDNLRFHIRYSSFEEALKTNILQDILYPLFLLLLSFILTIAFNHSFAPNILEMMAGFNVKTTKLELIIVFTKMLNILWYLLILILGILLLILLSKDLPYVLYIRFHQKPYFKTIRNIMTLRFCFVYQFFLNHNLNTQEFIKITQDVQGLDDIKWLTNHTKRNLEKGAALKDAIDLTYFNPMFKLYFLKGYFNHDLNNSLKEYNLLLEKIIHQDVKQLLRRFKIFVYVYILLFIGIYYIFLFQPLSILEAIV